MGGQREMPCDITPLENGNHVIGKRKSKNGPKGLPLPAFEAFQVSKGVLATTILP
jgi:hypothetical protein